jgi:quercetin dioxygenase-like cupin family protein
MMHHFSDHLYAKRISLKAGESVRKHCHSYSHLSLLASGRVVLERNGVKTWHDGDECINIAAGVDHTITAITDAVWYCIHATDEKDESRIDRVLIDRR